MKDLEILQEENLTLVGNIKQLVLRNMKNDKKIKKIMKEKNVVDLGDGNFTTFGAVPVFKGGG